MKRTLISILLFLTACSGQTPNFPENQVTPTALPPTATSLPPTATSIPMAITVNDEGITVDEFYSEVARYKTAREAAGRVVTAEDAAKAVSDDIISQILLAQGAAENGFVLDAAALQQRTDDLASKIGGADKLSAWMQAHAYTAESFANALKRAAASAWMRDRIMAEVPSTAEQVHVRQILLYNEDVAIRYYNQLQAGTGFDELAGLVDPVTRGDIGWFPRHYLVEKTVEDAAFSLEVGAYSAIVPSEVGFHIIKLLDRQPERGLSPDALSVMQTRALNTWLETRRQQSTIVLAP